MTGVEVAIALTAFAAGFAAGTGAWWLLRRSRPVDSPVAPGRPASARVREPGPASSADPGPSARPGPGRRGMLRTSQRVVLHLAGQPRLTYGEVAPVELTQAGMARALGVAQPALARVLGRLIDGDALLEMRTHVRGAPRRLKVYQLTVLGEAIARDLRQRVGPVRPAPPGAVGPARAEPPGAPAASTAET
jgi:DNA-binding MarR family transcriptional regulator